MRTEAHFPNLDPGTGFQRFNACACHECRVKRRVEKVTDKLLGRWQEKPIFLFSGSGMQQATDWDNWESERNWKDWTYKKRKDWWREANHDDTLGAPH